MTAQPPDDVFTVSSSTALAMAENLLLSLNIVVGNLPEIELRKIRDALENSLRVTDDLLFNITICSAFDVLTLGDVSTTLVGGTSTASSTISRAFAPKRAVNTSNTSVPPSSPATCTVDGNVAFQSVVPRKPTIVRREPPPAPVPTPVPAPVPVPTPAPALNARCQTLADPKRPMIISTRPHVGRPNYEAHPEFVKPGIPGLYVHPPIEPSRPDPPVYYVITKGLYVGIFTSWNECSPWVIKVPRSVFTKVRQWTEAMNLYNARLEMDSCEVLS